VFVYVDESFNGYFLSKLETRKVDNIRENPHVNLLFSDIESLQQVEYIANARVVDVPDEIASILPKIQDILENAKAEYWVPPLSKVPGNEYCIVEMTPMSITYRDYANGEGDSGAHQFKLDIGAL
jgi:general stress protein 26